MANEESLQTVTICLMNGSLEKPTNHVSTHAGLIVGVPLILSCIDMGFIAAGATINDQVCRDAARAAASGPPSQEFPATMRKVQPNQSPFLRALSVIKSHNPSDFPAKVQETPDVTKNVIDVPPAEVGGAVDGDVIVKTTVRIDPPFILHTLCPNGFDLSSKHLVPFTYVVPPVQPQNING